MKFTETPDQASEIANWENDGGASTSISDAELEREEKLVLLYLGGSVVSNWKRLPRNCQRLVFEDATANVSSSEGIRLKETIARFLHVHGGGRDPLNRRRPVARTRQHASESRVSGHNSDSSSPGQNCH